MALSDPGERTPACARCGSSYPAEAKFCFKCGTPRPTAPPGDPRIGQTLGPTVIQSLLGEGAMGKVYLAEQQALGRLVCVKTLQPQLAANPTLAARFEREAKTTSRLRHPNIVEILDFGRGDDGTLYLIMEYVEGEDLRALMERDAPLALQQALLLQEQILSALEEAHGAGVLHRDLKPENVLVGHLRDGSLRIKVVDFGIAKLLDEGGDQRLTRTGMVCGTPGYMAPEQILGDTLDARADVYAAGVILYEMVTGKKPLAAATVQEVMRRHLEEVPGSPSTLSTLPLPPALDTLVLSALEKRPERRFASATDFKQALQTLGRHVDSATRPALPALSPSDAPTLTCSACGTHEPSGRRFCGECGAALTAGSGPHPATGGGVSAASGVVTGHGTGNFGTGRQLLPEALAAHLSNLPSALQGEKRNVTVLFADLSGFTSMSETMEPEEVRALMNRCFDGMVEAVHRYEGMVDKFIGDCIMVVFGAPVAHEDDPERALRCAVEMLAYLDEVNKTLPRRLGFRIGVNAGEVVAGGVGGQKRMDYTVIGDVVNLAQRLEAAAKVGTVLVSATVERLTRRMARFTSLPPIRVKGKRMPIEVFELESLVGDDREASGRLIGRQLELRALRSTLSAAREGREGRCLIIARAGLGRSHLLAEFETLARTEGLQTVRVRCARFGAPRPLALVTQVAATLLDDLQPERAQASDRRARLELLELPIATLDTLDALLAGGRGPKDFLPDEAAQNARAALVDLFSAAGQTTQVGPAGLCFLIDDLHQADAASVAFLASLSARLPGLPCCLLATARAGEAATLWPEVPRLELAPLTDAEVMAVARGALDEQPLPLPLAEALSNRADGNPLFALELVQSFIDQGLLTLSGGAWTTTAAFQVATLPDSLVLMMAARIDRLAPLARKALRVGAVIGPAFGLSVVEAVLAQDGSVRPALEEAVHRGLLRPTVRPPGGFEFVSQSVRETVLGGLVRTDRESLHTRIAEVIEQGVHWGPEHPGEMAARHFFAAGQVRKGIRYATRAGDRLWDRGQIEAAALLYEQALEASIKESARLPRLSDAAARSILELAARATESIGLGDPQAGLVLSTRVLETIASHTAPAARAGLLLARAQLLSTRGRPAEVEQAAAAGLALLDAEPDPLLRARLLAQAGAARESRGDVAGATTQVLEALQQVAGGKAGAGEVMWRLLNQLGRLHLRAGESAKAIEFFENARAQARQHRQPLGEARALSNLGGAVGARGDQARAAAIFTEALSLSVDVGDRVGVARLHFNLGRLLLAAPHQRDQARQHLLEARDRARALGWREGLAAVAQVLDGLRA